MIDFKHITTIKDARIVEARKLISAVGRATLHECLLEGAENIERGLEAHMSIEHVFYHVAAHDDRFIAQLTHRGIPCYAVSDGILKKITHTTEVFPYIGVAAIPQALGETMDNVVLVMEHIQSHYILGTIIKAASALGIRDILSTDPHLDLFFRKIVSASDGKVFEARVKRFRSGREAMGLLQQQGYKLVATSPLSRDFEAIAIFQKESLVLT
ncbi:MAG: hypothetical protein NVS4B11_18500 [Ktedonobacteraceae bacterium]